MKKMIEILLVVLLSLSLGACSTNSSLGDKSDHPNSSASAGKAADKKNDVKKKGNKQLSAAVQKEKDNAKNASCTFQSHSKKSY